MRIYDDGEDEEEFMCERKSKHVQKEPIKKSLRI